MALFSEVVTVDGVADRAHVGKRRVRRVLRALEEVLVERMRADDVVLFGGAFFAKSNDPLLEYLADDSPKTSLIANDDVRNRLGLDDDAAIFFSDPHSLPKEGLIGFILPTIGMYLVPEQAGRGRMVIDAVQLAIEVLGIVDPDDEQPDSQWITDAVFAADALAAEAAESGREIRFRWDRIARESIYEDWLTAHLDRLEVIGFDVELYVGPDGRSGKQYRLPDAARIDVLTRFHDRSGFLVIELKSVQADVVALHQLRRYMKAVTEGLAKPHEGVDGLLIAEGATGELIARVQRTSEITYISWANLGYRPSSGPTR